MPADFAANVLELSSVRPLSASFNYISVWDATNTAWFKLRGDGLLVGQSLSMSQGATIDGGSTLLMSSLVVTASKPALDVQWTATAALPTTAVERIRSDIALDNVGAASYSLLRVQAKTTTAGATYSDLLSLSGSGLLTCTLGKVTIDTAAAASASAGTTMLIAGTRTIATTAITAASMVMLTYQGAPVNPGYLYVDTRIAGTNFQIASSNALDASTVAWVIIN